MAFAVKGGIGYSPTLNGAADNSPAQRAMTRVSVVK
jgi:hypothetical protein